MAELMVGLSLKNEFGLGRDRIYGAVTIGVGIA